MVFNSTDVGNVLLLLTILDLEYLHFLSKSKGQQSKGDDFECSYYKDKRSKKSVLEKEYLKEE